MEQKPVNLNEMSVLELKALAYDRIALKEQVDRELSAINQEIMTRVKGEREKLPPPASMNGMEKQEKQEIPAT